MFRVEKGENEINGWPCAYPIRHYRGKPSTHVNGIGEGGGWAAYNIPLIPLCLGIVSKRDIIGKEVS